MDQQAMHSHGETDDIPRSTFTAKKFTLDRRRAREIEDQALAGTLSEWLTAQTGIPCTAETLCQVVEDGLAVCILAKKFGQTTRYWDPPKTEFHRRENLALFTRACSRLNLSCEPIPTRKGLSLRDVVPCLMELATLAKKNARSMRRITAHLPEDLHDRLSAELDKAIPEHDSDDMNSLSTIVLDVSEKEKVSIPILESSKEALMWGGAQVLLRDILVYQRSQFEKPGHSLLCLGAGVTVCGLWAAMNGGDVVLTDFPQNIDLIWANVAANAESIRKAGGSCGARYITFRNHATEMAMVVADFDPKGELTVITSDHLFDCSQLLGLVSAVFGVRKDAKFFIVVQHDHVFQEFFKSLNSSVEFLQVYGDLEHRIIKGEAKGN